MKARRVASKKAAARKKISARKKVGQARARKFFAQGKRLFQQRKYTKARQAFEKAYRLWKHKVIEFNIALAYAFEGNKVAAGIYVRKYLKKAKGQEGNLPPPLQQVLDETGVLVISVPDPKAAILVDGREVGRGHAEVVVLAGARAVDIAVNDRVVARTVIDLPPDGRKVWELFEMPTRPLPRKTRKRPPRTSRPERPRPAGGPAVPATRIVRAPSRWSKLRRVHWAWFTATAAFAAASLGAAIGMSVTIRKMDQDCRRAPCNDGEEKKAFTYQKITNGLWGVTGGAAVAAGVLLLFTRFRKPESQISVTPEIRSDRIALSVRWNY